MGKESSHINLELLGYITHCAVIYGQEKKKVNTTNFLLAEFMTNSNVSGELGLNKIKTFFDNNSSK